MGDGHHSLSIGCVLIPWWYVLFPFQNLEDGLLHGYWLRDDVHLLRTVRVRASSHGHRHPRLGMHRCQAGSVSHLVGSFLSG